MKYGIFTQYKFWWDFHCEKILEARYPGYKTFPMVRWTNDRITLQDGTDIFWINTSNLLSEKICGIRFQCIHVIDGVSQEQFEKIILPYWCIPLDFYRNKR